MDIALVLPLDAPDYARAATAVRDGFLAAAQSASAADRCRVIAHDDKGVLAAFEAAKALGASVVVGPLVRDDLRRLAESRDALPLTLALNQLDDATVLPPQVYTLALSVEGDARVLARRMRDGGATTVVVSGDGCRSRGASPPRFMGSGCWPAAGPPSRSGSMRGPMG